MMLAMKWLPDMDLNHDKQIQSLLCYRYTIGQTSATKLEAAGMESRLGSREVRRPKVNCGAAKEQD